MARGKIVAICQSNGEFVTGNDGTMSYAGGEAHAIDVEIDMALSDLKIEVSNMFNFEADTFSIKYFLPYNRKTLITISSDKDLQRMIDFHADTPTADVYIIRTGEKKRALSLVADSNTHSGAIVTATMGTPEDAKRLRLCNEWETLITGKGQTFDSPGAFRDTLHKYAIGSSFMYKFIKNDGSRVSAQCAAEDCPWRIYASWSAVKQAFTIKKMGDTHTCERKLSNEGHRLANQRWIASVIKEKLRDSPNYRPKEIADDLNREYGLSLNYSQAWRGKFVAKQELHSSRDEAKSQLPWFCERILETNPGSAATLLASEDSKFQLFIAYHASLSGFEHGCRPLLFLDGFRIKANRQWKLLAATAVDGENEMFPVAFSIVEAESEDNYWNWFLVQLKSALSTSRTITFISNGQDDLEEEVPRVFEQNHHGYCVEQLIEDFKSHIDESSSSYTQEVKDSLVESIRRAAHAFTEDEFNECIDSIKTESEELAEWVSSTKPERWSDTFFKGLRYGRYSSTAPQTLNEWVWARREPSVVQMMDMIRCKLMEIMYTRREASNTWTETLTPSMNQKLQEEIEASHGLDIVSSVGTIFEVRDGTILVVNIESWECTCRRWQVSGLPCRHALAVIAQTTGNIYNYCSKYFTTQCYRVAYSVSINPIPDAGTYARGDTVKGALVCSPRARRLAGRPRVKPVNSVNLRIAVKRAVRCSRCKAYGHNKKTCKPSNEL